MLDDERFSTTEQKTNQTITKKERNRKMKKALTILMLAISLATFAQNATKVVVLDTYNKGGQVRQSILTEIKTNLAQAISDITGYEGIVDENVDVTLREAGFAEHPQLPREQAQQVADLAGTRYGLMSDASFDNFGYLTSTIILIDLKEYKILLKDTSKMNINSEGVLKGCETIAKKIVAKLPKPKETIAEKEKNTKEEEIVITESMRPRQLTSQEAEDVARHLNRADVCIEMNYIDNAIKEYEKILEIAPFWPNAYMFLANAYSLKNDEVSLAKARKNYKIFMRLTDDQSLYNEAKDKVSRMEMMSELIAQEDEKAESIVGTWRAVIHTDANQPIFIFDISKTPNPNKYQIILSPKSTTYGNIVNPKAYSEVIDGKLYWSYTFQNSYVPSQSGYNFAGAIVNGLFGNSLASAVGNAVIEGVREQDVGYTNIMDFDFMADVNMLNDKYEQVCDGYLQGSCQMVGEHHQMGQNNIELDSIYECDFLRGDGCYPVFSKIEQRGLYLYYGDIKLVGKNMLCDYSPYVSKVEYKKELNRMNTLTPIGGVLMPLSACVILWGALKNDMKNDNSGSPLIVVGGIGCVVGFSLAISAPIRFNNYQKRCIENHNKHVDENIRKFSQRDQASVSVNVGLTPTGLGVNLNF